MPDCGGPGHRGASAVYKPIGYCNFRPVGESSGGERTPGLMATQDRSSGARAVPAESEPTTIDPKAGQRGRSPLLYLAVSLFSVLWLFLSQTLPVWLEEVSVYPAPATPVLAEPSAEDPRPRFEPSCADPGPIRILASGVRPEVALCVNGRQYPLLIMSYASGLPYWLADLFWPIHQGNVFWLRGAGLLLGLLNIVFTRRLLQRITDTVTADVTALFLAVTPAFLTVQAMLVHFEVVPWLACVAALDQLSRCDALSPHAPKDIEPPPTGRLLVAAALIGLALLSNIKAVLLIAPLGLLALRAGVRFSALRPQQWLLAVAVLVFLVSPNLFGNTVDAGADFSNQINERWQFLLAQLDPMTIVAEIPNVARFWADTLIFMAIASGNAVPSSIPGMLMTLPPLFYCLFSALVYLWRGRGAVVPAACGLLIITFMFVSALLYVGVPKGNYGPLYAVFGIAMGATAVDGTRWLAARFHWRRERALAIAVVPMAGALIWSVVGRGSPASFTTMSINAAAVSGLGAYLTTHPEPEVPLLVTTYNLTGVPQAVTGGRARGIRATNYFEGCPPGRNLGLEPEPGEVERGRACIHRRFQHLLEAFPGTVRVLVAMTYAPVDDALAHEYERLLGSAAAAAGRGVHQEATFSGRGTEPLLRLLRIDALPMPRNGGTPEPAPF